MRSDLCFDFVGIDTLAALLMSIRSFDCERETKIHLDVGFVVRIKGVNHFW